MNFKYIFAFALGAAAGVAASWKFFETKYKNIAETEIDNSKEYYRKIYDTNGDDVVEEMTEKNEEPSSDENEEDYVEYTSAIKNCKYNSTSFGIPGELPYVIPPDAFGEIDGYSLISLTYYADKVIADDADHLLEDVQGTIGFDSLNHFGEYEDDSVFVRNDKRKCDYEILLSTRKYSEVLKEKPNLRVEIE